MRLTYAGLEFSIPIKGLIQIEDFSFRTGLNEHAQVSIRLLMNDRKVAQALNEVGDGAKLTIYEKDKKRLFCGRMISVKLVRETALNYLKIEAVSYTYDWELKERSQSFLDLAATYETVMKKVLNHYERAAINDCTTNQSKVADFLLQYEESDWTFLKRLASHFGTYLVPDITCDYGRVSFGIPEIRNGATLEKHQYTVDKSMEKYYRLSSDEAHEKAKKEYEAKEQAKKNKKDGKKQDEKLVAKPLSTKLFPQEVIRWYVATKMHLVLAEELAINDVRAIVSRVEYIGSGGEITKRYEISRKRGVRCIRANNPRIYGMSIPATVKERKDNTVRVHFDIDPKYDAKGNIKYFQYALETSSMYCMPEVGSKVHVYFPSHSEEAAIAVHAIRTGTVKNNTSNVSTSKSSSGGGGYAQDPDQKSFSNSNGAEMLLTPSSISFAAEAAKSTMVALHSDGTIAVTGESINLASETDIAIGDGTTGPAKKIVMQALQGINIAVNGGASLIQLTTEAEIKSALIKMDSTALVNKEVLDPTDEQIKELKSGDAARREQCNQEAVDMLEQKKREATGKMVIGALTVFASVAAISVVVATGGAALVVGVGGALTSVATGATTVVTAEMVAAAAVPAVTLISATAGLVYGFSDIDEGTINYNKALRGDLSSTSNYARDTFFGGDEGAYSAAKFVNSIVLGYVFGLYVAGLGASSQVAGILNLANSQAAHATVNVAVGAVTDLLNDGKINIGRSVYYAGVGVLQGMANKYLDLLFKNKNIGYVPRVTTKTVADVAIDAGMSYLTNQPFNVTESILKNLIVNGIGEFFADPIDIVTGAYYICTTDVVYPSLAGAVELTRSYLSTVKKVGSMGKGWQFKYDSRFYLYNGDVHVDTVTGENVLFRKVEDEWIVVSKGCHRFLLTEDQWNHTLTLRDKKDHITYVYNEEGCLSEIIDPNGQITKLHYTDGMISSLVTPLGLELRFTCKDGKITKISDPIGRKLEYRYDGDLLTDIIHMDQGESHYEYNSRGYLTAATDQNGVTYLVNEYDRDGRSIKQTLSNGAYYEMEYDDQNNRSRGYYADMDRTQWYYYDRDLQVTRIEYDDNTCVQYEYNDQYERTKEIDRKGNIKEWDYDQYGNLIHQKSADGWEVISTYDEQGDLITVSDNAGSITHYEYDNHHNCIRERHKIAEGTWQTRTHSYDREGRLIERVNANDHAIRYSYDRQTVNPIWMTNGAQEETKYEYDAVGRCQVIKNGYGRVEFGHNTRDFVTSRTDGEGNSNFMMYDKMGNMIAYYPPKAWVALEESYQYRYNDMEERVEVITPLKEHYLRYCNPEGDVIKEVHPNDYRMGSNDGIGVTYEYDMERNRIRVHHPEGGTERFFYDSLGNVIKHITPEYYDEATDDGKGYSYSYDACNRLTEVMNPDGEMEHRYQYDSCGNLIHEVDGLGHEVLYRYNLIGKVIEKRESINRDGDIVSYRVTLYDYDLEGNKIQERYGKNAVLREEYPTAYQYINFEYDANEHLTLVKDGHGAMMRYQYDCLGNRIFEEKVMSEGIYQRVHYRYNKAGLLILKQESIMGNGDCKWAVTKYAYDANSNLVKEITPNGHVIKREYDACDRLICMKTIDKANKIDRRVAYEYDKASNLIAVEESAPEQESSRYEYTYDWQDRLTHWKNPLGGMKRYVYDKNSRVLKVIDAENYGEQGEAGSGTTYSYDVRGNVEAVTNGLGIKTEQNAYNVMNRLTRKTDGVGNTVATEYTNDLQVKAVSNVGRSNTNQVLQRYQYNASGQVIGVVDGNQNSTHYLVDDWGRITKTVAADGTEEAYTYNEGGQVTSTTDANGNVITYKYNSFGKVAEIVDQEGQSEYFYYDAEQNQVRHVDRNGNCVEREFNVDGNLVKQVAKDSTGKQTVTNIYTYDGRGKLSKAVSNGFSYQYRYTKEGQLLEKSTCGKSLLRYTYNQDGRMTSVTDISGKTAYYEYDLVGRLQIVKDEREELVARYSYTNNGLLEEVIHGNGIQTCYQYNQEGNISRLVTKTPDVTLLDLAYTYDGNGNRLRKQGIAPAINVVGQRDVSVSYQYNVKNQLLQETNSGESVQYEYDKVGNRISKVDSNGVEQYQYNQKNQLIFHQRGDGNTTFTYDNQGSMIKEDGSKGITYYEYNPLNQQMKVVKPSKDIQVNNYDPEGLRVEMQENECLVRFLFHRDEILVEMDQEDELVSRFVRGYGLETLDQGTATYYYHKDEQFSTSFITNDDTVTQNVYDYDAFGVVRGSQETIKNRITYTGQQYDGITGQYYLRARYYNPVLGRFLQEDVYRGDGLNLYAYCDNNPVVYFDPSGYDRDKNKIGGERVNRESPYQGVKDASQYLKDLGLPRQLRKEILESFDVRTIKLIISGDDYYGLRFYGGPARANGPYLFETFTQYTNRANLALPPEWNSMSGIKQWKIKLGTMVLVGDAAPQYTYGSWYSGGAPQIWVPNPWDNLQD